MTPSRQTMEEKVFLGDEETPYFIPGYFPHKELADGPGVDYVWAGRERMKTAPRFDYVVRPARPAEGVPFGILMTAEDLHVDSYVRQKLSAELDRDAAIKLAREILKACGVTEAVE